MADVIFAEGISAYKPHEKAPDFVKANITVDAKKFQEWLQTHPELRDAEGRVRLTVKESAKEGNKWYLAVDTYRPEPKSEEAGVKPEDIPF
jgi:hypothetical protein